jgi:hypothetical protein
MTPSEIPFPHPSAMPAWSKTRSTASPSGTACPSAWSPATSFAPQDLLIDASRRFRMDAADDWIAERGEKAISSLRRIFAGEPLRKASAEVLA